jgi:hypothetical protein
VPRYLAAVCHEVGSTADRVGQLLAAVHGGHVAFEDETEEAGMTAEDLRRETGPCPACGANAANPVKLSDPLATVVTDELLTA